MIRLRRRKLSTFSLPLDSHRGTTPPRPGAASAVNHRHVLDIGISPRLQRQATDLRMLDWVRYGWIDLTHDPQKTVLMASKPRSSSGPRAKSSRSSPRPSKALRRASTFHSSKGETLNIIDEEPNPLTTRSLPLLPTNGAGDPMLRRPTVTSSHPVAEGGELFNMITKGRELKPFSFPNNPRKTRKFYDENFPLLCQKVLKASYDTSTPGTVTLEDVNRPSSADQRRQQLFERLKELELNLKQVESGDPEEAGQLVTELRSPVFDPSTWSWNRKRYPLKKWTVTQ